MACPAVALLLIRATRITASSNGINRSGGGSVGPNGFASPTSGSPGCQSSASGVHPDRRRRIDPATARSAAQRPRSRRRPVNHRQPPERVVPGLNRQQCPASVAIQRATWFAASEGCPRFVHRALSAKSTSTAVFGFNPARSNASRIAASFTESLTLVSVAMFNSARAIRSASANRCCALRLTPVPRGRGTGARLCVRADRVGPRSVGRGCTTASLRHRR